MKAFVCNSINPDLATYFKCKVTSIKNDVVFFANVSIAKKMNIPTSSFAKKSGFSLLFFVDFFWSFYVFIKIFSSKVNVVIFDTAHISNLPLALMCKLFKIKLVFTIHDWNPHEGSQSMAVSLYNYIVKNYLGDEFIVFSPVEFYKPVHILTLAGFDFKGSPDKRDYFLFFGRIEPYKGLRHIIEFANLLSKNNCKERIIVAGKGWDSALVKLKNISNVDVVNRFISDDELDDLIGGCIATLLPYDSASQSGVTILSYSYGKPVLAFNVGSLGYYIEDGVSGYLVEHDSHKVFFDKMIAINNNYDSFYANVCEYFHRFNKNALAQQYNKLLQKFD